MAARSPASASPMNSQFFLPGQLHELQHHAQPGVRFLRRRIETRQIEQRVVKLRQERLQHRGEVLRQLEEILESRGNIPRVRPLVEYRRQHRRQRKTVRLVVLGENLHHIAQQPQRHRRVRAALVLEEKIQQRPAPAHAHGKQQVRVHLLEAGLDERSGQHHQRDFQGIRPAASPRRARWISAESRPRDQFGDDSA